MHLSVSIILSFSLSLSLSLSHCLTVSYSLLSLIYLSLPLLLSIFLSPCLSITVLTFFLFLPFSSSNFLSLHKDSCHNFHFSTILHQLFSHPFALWSLFPACNSFLSSPLGSISALIRSDPVKSVESDRESVESSWSSTKCFILFKFWSDQKFVCLMKFPI